MGRIFWTGVLILALLLGLTLGISWAMNAIHSPLQQSLERAADAALKGDISQAQQLGDQAKQRWDTFRKAIAVVADHTPMDEIDQLFGQMRAYACAEEETELAACCAQLSRLIQSMADAHILTWWNLF